MSFKIKKAEQQELDEIQELVNSAVCEMESNQIMQWDDLYPTREDFEQDIKEENLYVGYLNGELAVIFALNQEAEDAYKTASWESPQKSFCVIHRLCVHSKYQNCGIAMKTMEFIEEIVLKKGIEAIRLDVFSENPYALKLYSKCGFKQVGNAQWRKGEFYLMEKYLE